MEKFAIPEVKQSCPLVTNTAQVAVMDDLPVAGIDFLVGNDLASGRALEPISTSCEATEDPGKIVPDSIRGIARSQTRMGEESPVTFWADCRATE